MEHLRALIVDIEKTSNTLQEASEHMKKLEKSVEFNHKRYTQAKEVLTITYDRIKDDCILKMYFPELLEYMEEEKKENDIRGKDLL